MPLRSRSSLYTMFSQNEGILFHKRIANGRCIAILFKSIGVRGWLGFPDRRGKTWERKILEQTFVWRMPWEKGGVCRLVLGWGKCSHHLSGRKPVCSFATASAAMTSPVCSACPSVFASINAGFHCASASSNSPTASFSPDITTSDKDWPLRSASTVSCSINRSLVGVWHG